MSTNIERERAARKAAKPDLSPRHLSIVPRPFDPTGDSADEAPGVPMSDLAKIRKQAEDIRYVYGDSTPPEAA